MTVTDPFDVLHPLGRLDPLDPQVVVDCPAGSLLGRFNRAGVLAAADVHVARRLGRLGRGPSPGPPAPAVERDGWDDDVTALAAALAVRAPRVGHVAVDLRSVHVMASTDLDDVDLGALPWPDPDGWVASVAASPLVAEGDAPAERPLRLAGGILYLDRYWRDELVVAAELRARAGAGAGAETAPAVDGALDGVLARLFPDDGDQRRAASGAVGRALTVLVGGPGTGKTTTVARLLAVLQADPTPRRPPLVALAAPTGKAAARLEEAVYLEAGSLPLDDAARDRLRAIRGVTLHRLLGARRGAATRFRYHRGMRLPHDVVVVDEASMVSLGLMARLLEAVRPDARLVLVGDPDQLASVEAGAVLADVVGPARDAGAAAAPLGSPSPVGIASSIAVLRTNHRFRGALADLADAVRSGRDGEVVEALRRGDVGWVDADPSEASERDLAPLRDALLGWAAPMVATAEAGDAPAAVAAMRRGRLLCAHREGDAGAATWNARAEAWLAALHPDVATEGIWYAGRPVLVTANDYSLRLFNGDAGVVVASGDGPVVAFDSRQEAVRPGRLADVETVFAMTVHKSQGSEFDTVALVLPPPTSRLLTRELLYTAVTRAKTGLLVVGSEASVRLAVTRPVARASGLTARLWG